MGVLAEILEGVPVSIGAPSAFGELEVLTDVYEVAGGAFDDMREALNRILALKEHDVHIRLFRGDVIDGRQGVLCCVFSTGDSRRIYQTPMFKRWRNGFSDKRTADGGATVASEVYSGGYGWGTTAGGVACGWSGAGWAA